MRLISHGSFSIGFATFCAQMLNIIHSNPSNSLAFFADFQMQDFVDLLTKISLPLAFEIVAVEGFTCCIHHEKELTQLMPELPIDNGDCSLDGIV